jgi:hypothetical protein
VAAFTMGAGGYRGRAERPAHWPRAGNPSILGDLIFGDLIFGDLIFGDLIFAGLIFAGPIFGDLERIVDLSATRSSPESRLRYPAARDVVPSVPWRSGERNPYSRHLEHRRRFLALAI